MLPQLGEVDQLPGGGIHVELVGGLGQVAQHSHLLLPLLIFREDILQLELEGALQLLGGLVCRGDSGGCGHSANILGHIIPPEGGDHPVLGTDPDGEVQRRGQPIEPDGATKRVIGHAQGIAVCPLLKNGLLPFGKHQVQQGLGLLLGLGPVQVGEAGAGLVLIGGGLLLPVVQGEDLARLGGRNGEGLALSLPIQRPLGAQRSLAGLAMEGGVVLGDGQGGDDLACHLGQPAVSGLGSHGRSCQAQPQRHGQSGGKQLAQLHE